jgi:hypothetical protein
MLITGGLLILGLAGLLGAFFIARGADIEERQRAADPALPQPTTVSPTEAAAASQAPLSLAQAPEDIELVSSRSQAFEQFLLMYEQFHELVEKIQLIHERSIAIEERLDRISGLVERIEEEETTLIGIPSLRRPGRMKG